MTQKALYIDYEFCSGCHSCEVACRNEIECGIDDWGIKVLEDSAVTSFGNEVTWRNSNALINPDSDYYFQGCLGGKTGFTTPAGQCMAVAAERNGRQIVAIVMKAETPGDRFADAVRLLNYGFAH